MVKNLQPTSRCAACRRPAYPHPMDSVEEPRQPICAGCGFLENDCACDPLPRTSHREGAEAQE